MRQRSTTPVSFLLALREDNARRLLLKASSSCSTPQHARRISHNTGHIGRMQSAHRTGSRKRDPSKLGIHQRKRRPGRPQQHPGTDRATKPSTHAQSTPAGRQNTSTRSQHPRQISIISFLRERICLRTISNDISLATAVLFLLWNYYLYNNTTW